MSFNPISALTPRHWSISVGSLRRGMAADMMREARRSRRTRGHVPHPLEKRIEGAEKVGSARRRHCKMSRPAGGGSGRLDRLGDRTCRADDGPRPCSRGTRCLKQLVATMQDQHARVLLRQLWSYMESGGDPPASHELPRSNGAVGSLESKICKTALQSLGSLPRCTPYGLFR